ncbi:MAG TPA: DUF192 domain-containing protein [Nitrospirales bacterium]|nr:DUF192 domain-containing protein [Nitrospirales bacterium]
MTMYRRLLLVAPLVALLCLAAVGCFGGGAETDENNDLLPVTLPNGTKFLVEVADTDHLREQGLMHREHLPRDRGMLFVFEREQLWAFWMKNTLISLDVVWLDADGLIVDVAEGMQPCEAAPCRLYHPNKVSSFALEIVAGRYAEEGLKPGMRLSFLTP